MLIWLSTTTAPIPELLQIAEERGIPVDENWRKSEIIEALENSTQPKSPSEKPKYRVLSLFSGAGGDSLGMTQAGCSLIAYNEFNERIVFIDAENVIITDKKQIKIGISFSHIYK